MITQIIIIPEPHIWDKTFKNRVNYPTEINSYLVDLIDKIESLEGEKIVIFPGDIFHRGFTEVSGMAEAFSIFQRLNGITNNRVYSCVGNHELSYRVNNPFWMLAHDQTDRFSSMRGLRAYGSVSPGIQIVDSLDIGPLNFVFGHYDRHNYTDAYSKDTVFISHNTLLESEIVTAIGKLRHQEGFEIYGHKESLLNSQSIPVSKYLKYVFVGHMHTCYSSFDVEEVVEGEPLKFFLQYMGSIGRTSISEIDDNDLVRTIPVFHVNASSYEYSPFTIALKSRNEVVREDVVEENKRKYEFKKAVAALDTSNVFGETAEACIERQLSDNQDMLMLFNEVYNNKVNMEIQKLLTEAEAL